MNTFYVSAILLIITPALAPASAADLSRLATWSENSEAVADHSAWKAFLGDFVISDPGDGVARVRYSAVDKGGHERLEEYISDLAALNPTDLGKSEAFAYWANLYNALTVGLILDRYPVKSIRDIKPSLFSSGPWKMDVVVISGQPLTLDDIEHGILRAHWKDPRIHYAVNCASIGCPNLRSEPFTGKQLESQLDEAARDYVNHPRGARFDDSGRLIVSSIYKWFAEDFSGTEQGVIDHISLYAEGTLARRLRGVSTISRYEYDWSLNDAK